MITVKFKYPYFKPPFIFKMRTIQISGKIHFKAFGFWVYYCTLHIKSEYLKLENWGFVKLFGNFYLFTKSKKIHKFFNHRPTVKKIEKKYRYDLNLWETKTWYGYKYKIFGQPAEHRIFRK